MEHFGLKLPHWFLKELHDPEVTDLCLNGVHTAYSDRGNGMQLIFSKTKIQGEEKFEEETLRDWVIQTLSQAGKSWDAKYPFVDATLCSGHRLHVTFPPLSPQGILVSLRRLCGLKKNNNSTDSKAHWKDSPLYLYLTKIIKEGDSLLISGATGSGKTTLANDLLGEISYDERIIALEDTQELAPNHPHFLSLLSRPANSEGYGGINLRTLLKQTLRMRPDRIILGECRGAEVLELLQAINTGHKGALATLHSNSPRDALRRIELLCLLSSHSGLPLSAIRELLSLGIKWITQVKKIGKTRKITELWKIEGREGDTILMRRYEEGKIFEIQ